MHRVCEMNQDAYIFQRMNLGDIVLAEHLDSGIGRCGDLEDPDQLDPDIRELWEKMLRDVYPDEFEAGPPDMNKWHRRFKFMVEEIAGADNILMPLARHVSAGLGLLYPEAEDVDMQYVEALETPEAPIHFDDLFDKAVGHVGTMWSWVARGVLSDDDAYLETIGNWNLDTGRDEDGQLVFWDGE